MPAATHNLTIEQGATFQEDLLWTAEDDSPINLTGYTARMQIRSSIASNTVLHELLSADNEIILGGAEGTIRLIITATDTATFSWTSGVYDLELTSGTGFVTRLVKGTVTVDPEVTR